MLKINQVSLSFKNYSVLENFSLNLKKGEIATLIGASGSGKTTLLKVIAGLLHPCKGELLISDTSPPQAYQHVAYMMQDDLLLPWRNILSNLMLVGELGTCQRPQTLLKKEAHDYLFQMGLQGWEEAYPDQMSGGMRQRVSLTRAMMQKRPLLLLDEPFASLDVSLREKMYRILQEIRQQHGMTILMVTHDFRDALALSDRIFLLSDKHITHEWHIKVETRKDPQAFQCLHSELLQAISE